MDRDLSDATAAARQTATAVIAASTPRALLGNLVLEQLQAAHDLLASGPASIHQGVHQARKQLRRVRAALALAGPELGASAQGLDTELGRLCRGLSPLRDAQALVEALTRLGEDGAVIPTDLSAAIVLAEQRRETVLAAAMARDAGFASRRRRIKGALVFVGRLPWQRVDCQTAMASLDHARRRVAKAEKRANKHPGRDEAWHRLRRRVRRLRQMQSLAQAAFGIDQAMHDDSEHLATALGQSQDDTLIVRHCQSRSPFPAPMRRDLYAIATGRIRHARR